MLDRIISNAGNKTFWGLARLSGKNVVAVVDENNRIIAFSSEAEADKYLVENNIDDCVSVSFYIDKVRSIREIYYIYEKRLIATAN